MKFETTKNNYLEAIKFKTDKKEIRGNYEFCVSKLNHFTTFLNTEGIEMTFDITLDVIKSYASMMRETNSNNTIKKNIGVIRRCLEHSDYEILGLKKFLSFKTSERHFDMFTSKEASDILKFIDSLDEITNNNLMYKAIIYTLFDTAVRRTELLMIKRKHIHFNPNYILLEHTKNGEERRVPFMDDTAALLKKVLSEDVDHGLLFHNRLKNRSTSYKDLVYLMELIKDKTKIKTVHPHMFRHTVLSNLLFAGADVKSVIKISGHSNIAQLNPYQHRTPEQVIQVYNQFHKKR